MVETQTAFAEPDRPQPRENRLNDLSGKEWIKFTKSWFVHRPEPRGNQKIRHPASFPESLVREFVALSNYNLKKGPAGADGYDATTNDGLRVQIKANHSSSSIGFRGEADLLLVLKIESSAEWKELYYGPFKPVKDKASYSKRDNKYTIPVAKLQQIAK